jgi:hypothetical protein
MYGGYWAGETAHALSALYCAKLSSIRSAMTWRMRFAYCALRARST